MEIPSATYKTVPTKQAPTSPDEKVAGSDVSNGNTFNGAAEDRHSREATVGTALTEADAEMAVTPS